MKHAVTILISLILLSTIVSSINFTNYTFIHTVSYVDLTFGIGFILFLLIYWSHHKGYAITQIKICQSDVLIFLMASYILISFAVSSKYNMLLESIMLWATAISIYYIVRVFINIDNPSGIKGLFYIMTVFGLSEALYGIIQYFGFLPNLFPFKFGGSFGNPGDLANLIVISFTISLSLFFLETRKFLKIILLFAVLIQISVVALSLARTAWIACIVSGLATVIYFKDPEWKIKTWLQRAMRYKIRLCVIILILVAIIIEGTSKIYYLKSSSADGRLFIWKLSYELIHQRPLFGHGYNSFITQQHLAQVDFFKQHPEDTKHGWLASETVFAFNDFFQIGVEYGCCTLLIFFLLFFKIFGFKMQNSKDENNAYLFTGRITLVAIIICMLFSYPLQNPSILFCFFSIIALVSVFDQKPVITLSINKIVLYIATLIVVILLVFQSFYGYQTIKYGLKWKKAIYELNSQPQLSLKECNEIYNLMRHDRSFGINYGSVLYQMGKYDSCIEYYEKYGYLCPTSDIYLILGDSYEQNQNYTKAIENYEDASFLMPHKFTPKYDLFKIYLKTKQDEKARSTALEIKNMRIKVYSETVRAIKTEANEYLSKQDSIQY
jgi:O-antigen polymerase